MRDLPAGTVTFLFTDIEGSTALLHELGAERYADALAEHRRALRASFASHGGVEVDTQGDAFFVAFPDAGEALLAAREAQDALDGRADPRADGRPYRRACPDWRGLRRRRRAQGGPYLLGWARRADPRLGADDARRRGRELEVARHPPAQGPDRAGAAVPGWRGGVPAAQVAEPVEPAGAAHAVRRAREGARGGARPAAARERAAADADRSGRLRQDAAGGAGSGRGGRAARARRLVGRAAGGPGRGARPAHDRRDAGRERRARRARRQPADLAPPGQPRAGGRVGAWARRAAGGVPESRPARDEPRAASPRCRAGVPGAALRRAGGGRVLLLARAGDATGVRGRRLRVGDLQAPRLPAPCARAGLGPREIALTGADPRAARAEPAAAHRRSP